MVVLLAGVDVAQLVPHWLTVTAGLLPPALSVRRERSLTALSWWYLYYFLQLIYSKILSDLTEHLYWQHLFLRIIHQIHHSLLLSCVRDFHHLPQVKPDHRNAWIFWMPWWYQVEHGGEFHVLVMLQELCRSFKEFLHYLVSDVLWCNGKGQSLGIK